MTHNKAKIGVFGIGLAAYWPQFEGLKERLEGYQREVEAQDCGYECRSDFGGTGGHRPAAQQAGELFASHSVDLIICYVGTYATSSQVLPAVQRRKAPVLVLNLQPSAASITPTPIRVNGLPIAVPAVCRKFPMPLPAVAFSLMWCRDYCTP